jgi:hypothetical protein
MARKFVRAKAKVVKKKPPPSKTKLKAKAWELLSQIIRLENADEVGWVSCVSCGSLKFWKDLQAGHWVDGRKNSILFDRRGIWPQCSKCNVALNGNKIEYSKFMSEKVGVDVMEELRIQKWKDISWTADELEDRIDAYRIELKRLVKEKPVAASGRDL